MAASRKTPPDLIDRLTQQWPDLESGHSVLELGLSGGLDSVVLLHLLCRWRAAGGPSLSAVHVHHGLSAYADAWAAFCEALCRDKGVPLRVERVNVSRAGGESLEAEARKARYAAFGKSSAKVVVLAQHQDDQAETVVLQLLRGGGPHALAAMPAWRRLGGLSLWRPLLDVPRSALQAYAETHGLAWIEDDSNADPRWRRNWLRLDWLPSLAEVQPDYRRSLARVASNMADAAAMLDELIEQDRALCEVDGRLGLAKLSSLSLPRQRQLLLRWAQSHGLGEGTPAALEEFRGQLWTAARDRNPLWRLPHGVVQRYRAALWPVPDLFGEMPGACEISFDPASRADLPQWGGALSWRADPKGLALRLGQPLVLKPRQGGERLAQAAGRKPVKTLLQEAGIPPALRTRWPLLFDQSHELLALPSVAVAYDAKSGGGERWWPLWQPKAWQGYGSVE
ncbi:tRNA lysidine(34) synthetase TilS [Crenobacter cavernae]|uniref:tRNA(Ile)-lysidine synthase n=1 Tax=Crenobacter cavernae TaxID=2290923 RepID=A0ABY0FAY3_9NEIS|nr:tRNA lysidine(34) synthetase TilS [Crenobacter cavernae]RXZ42815.1 tRNA lysidine(34) synthetase TilS [Crenobacter cavernae]